MAIPLEGGAARPRLSLKHLALSISPLASIVAALVIGAALMLIFGRDPVAAYEALARGAFGSPFAFSTTISNSIPLVFTGLTVALAFRAGLFNIGAEGQVLVGALAAAWLGPIPGLPPILHVLIILTGSSIAGLLWALPPALFKVKSGAHEVITTLMMSFIAIQFAQLVLRLFLKDPLSSSGASREIAVSAQLPLIGQLIPGLASGIGQVHTGVFLAAAAALLCWVLLEMTWWGYEIRAAGLNPIAAATNGISLERNILLVILLGGALAGMAGGIQIMALQHKLYARSGEGLGFAGIAVALLANNNPLWIIPSATLFGALQSGATQMQLTANVPIELAEAIQGTIVFIVAIQNLMRIGVQGWGGRRV